MLIIYFIILTGFPLAFLHRYFFYGKKPYLQHMYFICTGIFLGYFNFGKCFFQFFKQQ